MNILDRKSAMLLGLKRFFTGAECRNGHIDERYVSTGGCLSCLHPHRAKTQASKAHLIPFSPDVAPTVAAYVAGVLLPLALPAMVEEAIGVVVSARKEAGAIQAQYVYRAGILARAKKSMVHLVATGKNTADASHYYDGLVDGKRWEPWGLVDAGLFIWVETATGQTVSAVTVPPGPSA